MINLIINIDNENENEISTETDLLIKIKQSIETLLNNYKYLNPQAKINIKAYLKQITEVSQGE